MVTRSRIFADACARDHVCHPTLDEILVNALVAERVKVQAEVPYHECRTGSALSFRVHGRIVSAWLPVFFRAAGIPHFRRISRRRRVVDLPAIVWSTG